MASKLLARVPTNLMSFIGMLLHFVGLLPRGCAGLSYSVLVSVCLLFSITPLLIDLFLHVDTLNNALHRMSLASVFFGSYLGHLLFLMHHKGLLSLINEVKAEYSIFLVSSEAAQKRLQSSHILIITLSFIEITSMMLFVLEPLLTQSNELVLPAWYPFSVDNVVVYGLIYIYQSFTVAFGGTIVLSATNIFCEINLHTIEHLDQLCLDIREAVNISNYPQELALESEMKRRLGQCAQRHALLLSRIDRLKKLFSGPAVIGFFFCMICTATVALETIGVNEEIPFMQIAKSCGLLLCATLALFPFCLIGQQVVDMQLQVVSATSDYYIVEAPDSVKRTMQIMNIRAQVPIQPTIGGLFAVNLVTYGEALKLAYGIFTMLLHFKS